MSPANDIPFEIRLEKEPLPSSHSHCLASIALGTDTPEGVIKTSLTSLIKQNHPFENWYAKQLVQHGEHQKLVYTYNDAVLFGHAQLTQKCVAEDLRAVYKDMVQLLSSKQYVLLRIWHYLPQLAKPSDYQVFCEARAQAFSQFKSDFYCAATVIGTDSDCGVVYFLAARSAGIAVNNPRQTMPHLYPKRYVEPTPMFARATLKQWGDNSHLYISGTAAIVGHESMHEGDGGAQLNEAVDNLKILLGETSKIEHSYSKMQLAQLQHIKLYVDTRVADDIIPLIGRYFGSKQIQIYKGQMCRPELLVEIEAMASSDHSYASDA